MSHTNRLYFESGFHVYTIICQLFLIAGLGCFNCSTSLLGNQPFLSVVLTCLRGQDEQREGLLKSLHDQLEKFVTSAKEVCYIVS